MQIKPEEIIDYYDSCEQDYRLFWNLDRSMAMHAGYWDESTQNLEDALRHENEVLAKDAKIQRTDRVLDAGCGVGGSAIYLAKTIGCEVVGITLSAHQVKMAEDNAFKHGVGGLSTFKVMDFSKTEFEDASFDVVWGLESVCHAPDKQKFVNEAFRLLKPGGRLIVADGFSKARRDLHGTEQKRMARWLRGWGVERLAGVDAFFNYLKEAGYGAISYRNVTRNVVPSSKRLFLISFPATVLSTLGEWFGVRSKVQTDNILAAYHQYTTLRDGLWEYGIFSAYKSR